MNDLAGLIERLRAWAADHTGQVFVGEGDRRFLLDNDLRSAADALERAVAVTEQAGTTCEQAFRMFEGDELIALKLYAAINDLRDFRERET